MLRISIITIIVSLGSVDVTPKCSDISVNMPKYAEVGRIVCPAHSLAYARDEKVVFEVVDCSLKTSNDNIQ